MKNEHPSAKDSGTGRAPAPMGPAYRPTGNTVAPAPAPVPVNYGSVYARAPQVGPATPAGTPAATPIAPYGATPAAAPYVAPTAGQVAAPTLGAAPTAPPVAAPTAAPPAPPTMPVWSPGYQGNFDRDMAAYTKTQVPGWGQGDRQINMLAQSKPQQSADDYYAQIYGQNWQDDPRRVQQANQMQQLENANNAWWAQQPARTPQQMQASRQQFMANHPAMAAQWAQRNGGPTPTGQFPINPAAGPSGVMPMNPGAPGVAMPPHAFGLNPGAMPPGVGMAPKGYTPLDPTKPSPDALANGLMNYRGTN